MNNVGGAVVNRACTFTDVRFADDINNLGCQKDKLLRISAACEG